MTMQVHKHPKPKVFGKGYGTHIAYHFKLFKKFVAVTSRIFLNMLIPSVYHERYHWDIIDIYHRLRGYRHGTENEKRCNECGTELMSRDEVRDLHDAEKLIEDLKDEIAYLEWQTPHNEDDPDSDK